MVIVAETDGLTPGTDEPTGEMSASSVMARPSLNGGSVVCDRSIVMDMKSKLMTITEEVRSVFYSHL